jgi:hypothetical protein
MVITPEALKNSKTFRAIPLKNIMDKDSVHDEAFYFAWPPPEGSINEVNGDGDLLEIWDWNYEFTKISVDPVGKEITVTPETIIYVR